MCKVNFQIKTQIVKLCKLDFDVLYISYLRYHRPTRLYDFPPVNMIMPHDARLEINITIRRTSRPFSDSLAVVVIPLIIRAAANVNERTWRKNFGFEKCLSKAKFQLICVPAVWPNALLSQTRIMEETHFTDTWEFLGFENRLSKTWSKCN